MPSERFVLDDHEVTVLNHVIYGLTERDDLERLVQHPADRQALHTCWRCLSAKTTSCSRVTTADALERARERLLPDGD